MARIWKQLDVNHMRELYESNITMRDIAKIVGCTRKTVCNRLRDAGVQLRTFRENTLIVASRTSPEERSRRAEAAHNAIRGTRQSFEHRCKIAKTLESRHYNVSPIEHVCADKLRRRGFQCTCQKAIGPYNIDVAINEPTIAVEIFGGCFHATGRHASRFRKRTDYILNQGWVVIIIWVNRDHPFGLGAIKYIVALAEKMRRGESVGSKEHMIYGNGHPSTIGENHLNGITGIPRPNTRDKTTGRFNSRPRE